MSGTIEKFDKYVMHTYGRYPLAMKKGSNAVCTDEDGKEYIDFGSGIGTNSLGFCDSDWVEAVCNQVKSFQHTSNYYYSGVQAEFAELLCKSTGYDAVFFGNSGAEANECAIKLARKYSFDKYGKGRHTILTLTNSFHGRTLATLSATGQDVFHNYFFPFVEGFVNVETNNIDDLKKKLEDKTVCAIMLEYIQGEGGVNALSQEFVDAIYEECAKRDILVITDEVQTGIGRTGKLLAGENFGHKGDIVTLAKGLAGGVPIGACLTKKEYSEVLSKGMHGSTFGGNPIACAGGLAVLKKVTSKGFLENVRENADYLRAKLIEIDGVELLSGIGMMIGITLKDKKAADVGLKCFENGLLVLTAKEKVRLLPPLTITKEEIDKGIEIFKKVLAE
ncbi:MAG: aspartate aminotransferase family protein [Oscillospiraceae bacterium]|nr:aspartate aminotransferase family protein [Oscillospiraceae bacterium]MDD6086000.1 aspartate aminotransferase family protein [Oscillospiraceae bacterium]MDY3258158.1 aspartate aminotransferase family protein [Ruminococcus callidus]